jgi:Xaa-Pro dipeptidase
MLGAQDREGTPMSRSPPHFTREEYARRLDAACRSVATAGLDGVLLFKQESMYWLTGYDTFGYCFFQCLVLRADGRTAAPHPRPDLRQARHTSVLDDVRVWVDRRAPTPPSHYAICSASSA